MKYIIVKQQAHIVIKMKGTTRDNEPLLARRILSQYLRERGIQVILDLKEIEGGDPIALMGVLNSIRKEIGFLRGGLKLCSLRPKLLTHFKENRLDRMFTIYEDEQAARKTTWRTYEQG
jgi:anti-anti-sigma regulatory factor